MKHDKAIVRLEAAAEVCEHNAPIHAKQGDKAQAKLSRDNAKAYRAAIEELKR